MLESVGEALRRVLRPEPVVPGSLELPGVVEGEGDRREVEAHPERAGSCSSPRSVRCP